MRSTILSTVFVSCTWLAAVGCGAASSSSDDAASGAGSAGAPLAIAGSAGSSAGNSAAGADPGGASAAGSGGAVASSGAGSGGASAGAGGSAGGTSNAHGGIVGPTGLIHPGILVDKEMLDFVKAKIAAGASPWKAALAMVSSDDMASLSYKAKPRATVECGPSSMPDNGCTDEKNDVIAAYTHALIWYHTGDQKHAAKAIEIMNAWSAVLKQHTNDNAQLQAAWTAEVFPRAAEIIRYSNAGWAQADVDKFSTMLKTAYLPEVKDGSTRTGNWDTSAIEAAMNIAIFTDDMDEFKKAVALWRARTPAYVYLTSDGPLPVQPPRETAKSDASLKSYWFNPKAFVDGLIQETCRDTPGSGTAGFGHAQYGVAAIINAAETAGIQGVDLFSAEQKRLSAMLELHAGYLNKYPNGVPPGLCSSTIAGVQADPMWDIGYNAYANVLKLPMPETAKLVQKIRPTEATHHMAWETLTHGDIGAAGW